MGPDELKAKISVALSQVMNARTPMTYTEENRVRQALLAPTCWLLEGLMEEQPEWSERGRWFDGISATLFERTTSGSLRVAGGAIVVEGQDIWTLNPVAGDFAPAPQASTLYFHGDRDAIPYRSTGVWDLPIPATRDDWAYVFDFTLPATA
jgi:hypothetical protein